MATVMTGHDRSFAVMHAVMDGQVMDASTIIDYGRVHDRSWAVMHTVTVGHAHGHGRPCTRQWRIIIDLLSMMIRALTACVTGHGWCAIEYPMGQVRPIG